MTLGKLLPNQQAAVSTLSDEPWLSERLGRMHYENGKPMLPADAALSETMRQAVEDKRRSCLLSLGPPADDDAASVELYRMLTAFPARAEQAEMSVALRVEAYFTAIGQKPIWALRSAVDDVLRGEAGVDSRFAPTPPQLAEITERHIGPVRAAAHKLSELLAAEVEPEIDEEQRARTADWIANWRETFKWNRMAGS